MNRPSSTITAAAISGAIAAVMFGIFAVFAPVQYALVPPGMEAGVAVLIGSVIGYCKRERVLNVRSNKG